jgi:hypothetical protein
MSFQIIIQGTLIRHSDFLLVVEGQEGWADDLHIWEQGGDGALPGSGQA